MSTDRRMAADADLQQKLSEMAESIDSPTNGKIDDTLEPSDSLIGNAAGQSEVDIRAAEAKIKTFLASGIKILRFSAEVTKIREACEFLTSPQLVGMIPMQRKAAIYCLKSELDSLISKLFGANTVMKKYNEVSSRLIQWHGVADGKRKEIDQIEGNKRRTLQELNEARETLSTLERQMDEVKMTISQRENILQTLFSRYIEVKHEIEVISKKEAQEREELYIPFHKAKKDRKYVVERWKSIQSLFGDQ